MGGLKDAWNSFRASSVRSGGLSDSRLRSSREDQIPTNISGSSIESKVIKPAIGQSFLFSRSSTSPQLYSNTKPEIRVNEDSDDIQSSAKRSSENSNNEYSSPVKQSSVSSEVFSTSFEAEQLYKEGLALAKAQKYNEAKIKFADALVIEPHSTHYQFAIEEMTAKIDMGDINSFPTSTQLVVHDAEGRKIYDHATEASSKSGRKVDISSKQQARILYAEGEQLMRSGEYGAAIKKYCETIALDRSKPEYGNSLAFAYYLRCKGNDLEKAEKICKEIISNKFDYGPAHDTLGCIYRYQVSEFVEEGNTKQVEKFKEYAKIEFVLSRKYQTKKEYSYYIDKSTLFMQVGDHSKALEYLEKAEKLVPKQKRKHTLSYNDEEGLAVEAKQENARDYIKELKGIVVEDPPEEQSFMGRMFHKPRIKHEVDLTLVKKAVDGFKMGLTLSQLKGLQADLASLKSVVVSKQDLQAFEKNIVHRDEVSVAIVENGHREHVQKQNTLISSRHEWKEYYDAFRSMFNNAYAVAQIIKNAPVTLEVGSMLQEGISTAIGLIPFCGDALSKIFDKAADAVQIASMKKSANFFLHIAPTITDLESIIDEVGRDLATHPQKSAAILNVREVPKVTGLVKKAIEKCKQIKHAVASKLEGGELYETPGALHGVQDASDAIKSFLNFASRLQSFADKQEVIKCLKYAIIVEKDWEAVLMDDHSLHANANTSHLFMFTMGDGSIVSDV